VEFYREVQHTDCAVLHTKERKQQEVLSSEYTDEDY